MIAVILILLLRETNCLEPAKCKSDQSQFNEVTWPSTDDKTISQPPCLNENQEFLYRECRNGQWAPEPNCTSLQMEAVPQCPDDFTDVGSFCYKLSPKSHFPPECPFQDVIPFDSYKHVIEEPVWMPVQRNLDTGLGFLQWVEASSLYKTPFKDPYVFEGPIIGKNCLLYHNSSYIRAVSCNENHPGVCAYYKLNQLSSQLCGTSYTCYRSDFPPNSKCFCLGTNSGLHRKAEFLEPYQNQIYRFLTNDSCAIGLEKTNGTYIWSSSQQAIGYTYWSPDVVFDDSHVYGAATSDGWVLTEEAAGCYLFETEPQLLVSALRLMFNNATNSFTLGVHNPRSFKTLDEGLEDEETRVYCFTDAWPSDLLYRYPALKKILESEDSNYYEFGLYDVDVLPGTYWCEGFSYDDLSHVLSDRITIQLGDVAAEYVATVSMNYNDSVDPRSPDTLSFFQDNVFPKFVNTAYLSQYRCVCRLMKIVELYDQNRVQVNIHFSIQYQESVEFEEDISTITIAIAEVLESFSMALLDFRSSLYCFGETVNNVTWPVTAAGSVTKPSQLCMNVSGQIATRWCRIDSFVDGAYWYDNTKCETPEVSALTEELYQLLLLNDTFKAAKACTYSEQTDELKAVDLYLLSEVLGGESNAYNKKTFVATSVDNVIRVNRSILRESQKKFKATDLLLHTLDVANSYFEDINTSGIKNFALERTIREDSVGFALQKDGDVFIIKALNDSYTLEDIQRVDNIESAIWISPELASCFPAGQVLSLIVFYNDALFNEVVANRKALRVFNLQMPSDYDLGATGSVLIMERVDNNSKKFCSRWNFDTSKSYGFWEDSGELSTDSSFILCEYSFPTEFPIAVTSEADVDDGGSGDDVTTTTEPYTDDNRDVTQILVDLLESNKLTSELTLRHLRDTSQRYSEFQSNDIHLVGKIFRKLSDEDVDLEDLAEIVSNLHNIEPEILSKSQNDDQATDLVLHYLDVLIQNQNFSSDVTTIADNFMIFVCGAQNNVSGLAWLSRNGTTESVVLEGDIDDQELAQYDDLECAAVVDPKLKDQMSNGSRIIITVFNKDVLFNDGSNGTQQRVVNRIFGVILPEIDDFDAPVSILHKVPDLDSYDKKCVHWGFNSSSWEQDSTGNSPKSYILQCDFWHTTHFALLLLDQEPSDDYGILDIVTKINCVLSLVGLGGIFLTAVFFQKWRANTGNRVLLNFAFAITLQIIIFYISDGIRQSSHSYLLCTVIGCILHYSTISQFFWMLIIAVLQYKRFVKVLGTHCDHIFLKACFGGWVLPLVPVFAVLIFDNGSYVNGKVGLCYPSGMGLYLGIWLPTLLVLAVDLFLFIWIMSSVACQKTSRVGGNEGKYQLRLAILLYFMLGLAWIFAFLVDWKFGEVFLYLFTFTVTLQGHVLFLFFIVFNLNTRYMYLRALGRLCGKSPNL